MRPLPEFQSRASVALESPLREICALLGVTYEDVREIVLRPRETLVTLYLHHDGRKYIDADTGEAATTTLRFETRTS